MNNDSEEADLPEEIGEAAIDGEFERVKAWLAGGSPSAPRSVNSSDESDWTLLHWTSLSGPRTPEYVEFARYLLSRGARVDAKTDEGQTALHFLCARINTANGEATAALVSMFVAAGATVNMRQKSLDGRTPLFMIDSARSESTLDIVTILLRAGASLDLPNRSFEEHLDLIERVWLRGDAEHVGAIRDLVASVRAAGSWKAHCISPHKQILRLRSLVARGRTRERLATTRAIRFIVRQGDNGIVWNILSYWRETG